MNLKNVRLILMVLAVATFSFALFSCAPEPVASKLAAPAFFADDVLDKASVLITEGYQQLDSNQLEQAVATFGEIEEIIPNGLVSNYHIACAYGRTGQTDKGFVHLDHLVKAGYDTPINLEYDSDLESLKSDPRWHGIVAEATANAEAGEKQFAAGMTVYDTPPIDFPTIDSLETWVDGQKRRMGKNRMAWTGSQYTAARVDLAAKQLSCLEKFKKGDPEFNMPLERVRAAATILSPYDVWGGVADLVVAEVKNLLALTATEAVKDEAKYRAGMALSLKYAADDDRRSAGYADALQYLQQVSESSEFFPAAQTLMLIDELRLPGADASTLDEKYREVVSEYATDANAYRMISTQYGPETVAATWPVPLTLNDLDGKPINLDDYQGKVLLIDFWATWCGPCRAELPELTRVYNEYHGQGFEIVSISLDNSNQLDIEKYKEWINERGMNWRHSYAGTGWDRPMVKSYFVSSIPAPFMVGRDGALVAWGEDCRGEKLEQTVKNALGGV